MFIIISPDKIPIRETLSKTETAAWKKWELWTRQFKIQGYYAAVGRRIPLDALRDHCSIQSLTRKAKHLKR